ncbi:MAG TPA: gamma-glutamyltransferase [Rubrobacteraceae bacterium]|nr:gamma-glutamyltransferase [Rubrobacteraceae bacterium]
MRRIIFVALIVVVLSSCGGAQSATAPEVASREGDAVEETISLQQREEGLAGEESSEPTTASTITDEPNIQPTANTLTSPAVGGSGMVSSAHPLATQAGLDVLAEGGNAFDAAVAVAAALNVVEPFMSGIGGYGTVIIYDAEEGEVRSLDAGSRQPASLDPDAFHPPTQNYLLNRRGAKAVATPASVDAWETLWEDYGTLQWPRLFNPAIELAEGGFVLDGIAAEWIGSEFSAFPEHARRFYGNNGVPLRAGERLVQKELARSLTLIAEQGAEVVHSGELGRAIDAAMRENDGFLTIDDLRNNRARWRETINIDHRGYEVVTASPPITSWGALLRLGIMGQFDLQAHGHNSAQYLHTFAEVTKRAYWARLRYSADPEEQLTPLDLLLSEEYWTEQAARINPSQATPYVPPTTFNTPASSTNRQEHTTHFVVADKKGNIVSATQTIGNVFGSRIMPRGTGIWLNDSIAYSTFEPKGNPLDALPGRQRLIGVAPILVMSDGRPWVAIGTPGGYNILQTTPQMLMNLIDFDMNIQQAISAPRISFIEPDVLAVENSIPEAVRSELAAKGHNIRVESVRAQSGLGNAYGLIVEYGPEGKPIRFTGGADPRGEGAATGY